MKVFPDDLPESFDKEIHFRTALFGAFVGFQAGEWLRTDNAVIQGALTVAGLALGMMADLGILTIKESRRPKE